MIGGMKRCIDYFHRLLIKGQTREWAFSSLRRPFQRMKLCRNTLGLLLEDAAIVAKLRGVKELKACSHRSTTAVLGGNDRRNYLRYGQMPDVVCVITTT